MAMGLGLIEWIVLLVLAGLVVGVAVLIYAVSRGSSRTHDGGGS